MAGPESLKNMPLSAAGDLGLGQQLQISVADQEEELRKKKVLQQQGPGQFGDQVLNPATMALYGGMK